MSLHVGEAVGDYRVIGIAGAGGMGQVFQVEHKITKRKEAMKVLIADVADETQIQRFKREIEVQARLNHPNIAAVHNAFRLKDRIVLVMELVEGKTLENLLQPGRPLLANGIDYVRQALRALDYAHHNGVIHRDVSPPNLIVTESGLVKLMDFGVAKSLGDLRLTDAGSMIGSLYYMSPEQVKGGGDPDPRSDIYSVGAILYEIATGQRPFDYDDRFSLMVAQVEEQPRRPSQINPEVSTQLDEIIMKALAKDPNQRYQSARDFLAAIEITPIIEQPVADSRAMLVGRSNDGVHSEAVASVVVVMACALAGFGTGIWNRLSEPAPLPAVVLAVSSAPESLAAIPPARLTVARPASAAKAVVKQSAASQGTRGEPSLRDVAPVETRTVEVQPAAVQGLAPVPQQSEAQPSAQQAPEGQPDEPKKGGFWGKLNPFRGKPNPFKKRKEASAFRSTDADSPAGRQE
jgi:serine/threonine-protein kinase